MRPYTFLTRGVRPAPTERTSRSAAPRDLIGIGIGPFNLGLAALLDSLNAVDVLFFDEKPKFDWHPGLLLEGTTLQVPFLADLVTLVDPTSPYTFLNYARDRQRLYRLYFLERFHVPRREYDDYCRWVADRLASCRFGRRVEAVRWVGTDGTFEVLVSDPTGTLECQRARNIVVGVGTVPVTPPPFARVLGPDVFHSAEFAFRRKRCRDARSITVIGSGQSGAEVYLALLEEQPRHGYRLDWMTRSSGFFPMESSKLALEHFSPNYVRYFYRLPEPLKERLVADQSLLYKGIDAETIRQIYDLLYEHTVGGGEPPGRLLPMTEVLATERADAGYRLRCRQWQQGAEFHHASECVVLATGYEPEVPACLDELRPLIHFDAAGRYRVQMDYRLELASEVRGRVFVQNGELHTHGVGAPDLGLGAYRSAVIVNSLLGRTVYALPERTSFTQFGAG